MRIMGIDPGTRVTGYGVIDVQGNKISAVDFGAIRTGHNDSFPVRLKKIYDELTVVIAQHRPDAVAVEEAFYGKNVRSTIRIGEGRAVAILAAANAGLPVAEYSAREVKKSAVGAGGADKSQVQEMVRIILSLREKPEPLDASDALAIAICHSHRIHLDTLIEKDSRKG